MAYLANLLVRIGIDAKDLRGGLDSANRSVKAFGDQLSSAGFRAGTAFSLPIAAAGLASLKAAGQIEQASVAFQTMLKSADAASAHLKELREFALATPFQFPELIDASRRMQAFGFSAKEVVPTLRTVGNAIGALGLGAEGLNRVIINLGQLRALGRANAREFRDLASAGIPAWEALAKALGTTVAGAMEKVEKRAVDSGTAINAILTHLNERFAGGMEAQTNTLIGQWAKIREALFFTLADVGESLAPAAKSIIENQLAPMLQKVKEVARAFRELPAPVQASILGLTGFAAVAPILAIVTGQVISNTILISQTMGNLARVALPAALAATGKVISAFGALGGAAAAASPAILALSAAVGALILALDVKAIYDFGKALLGLRDAQKQASEASKLEGQSLAELEVRLRQHGADFSRLRDEYKRGQISTDDYRRALIRLAISMGEAESAQRKLAGAPQPKLSAEDIEKLRKTLGLEDLTKKSGEMRAAFNALRAAWKVFLVLIGLLVPAGFAILPFALHIQST